MKDPNFVLKLEKEIIKKYGEDTVKNPNRDWNIEKEQKYLQDLKIVFKQELKNLKDIEFIDIGGVSLSKKLFTKENNKICFACKKYSFNKNDDIYLSKFKCCFICYIKYVENREEKWIKNLPENKLNK